MAGIAVLTSMSLSLTGCGPTGDDASSTPGSNTTASAPAKPKEPKEVLVEAAQKSAMESFHYTMTYSVLDMAGDFDPANKSALIKTKVNAGSQSMSYDTMLINQDAWLKYYGVSSLPKKWLHIGTDALGADNKLWKTLDDPTGASGYTNSAVDVQKVDDAHFKGTIDATKNPNGDGALQKSALEQMGDAAKAIPFEAELDDKGRLSKVTMDMPKGGAQPADTMQITFSDYGTSVSIKAPAAADTQEAPEAVLKGFKNL